jgi:hypothetical protein
MKLSLLCAAVAFVSGGIAAWYWYKSTQKNLPPVWEKKADGGNVFHAMQWIESLADITNKVSDLNRKAALWSAGSVFASALAAFLETWASN